MFLLLSIVLLEIYTLQKTAFRNSNFFGFYGTLKIAEIRLGLETKKEITKVLLATNYTDVVELVCGCRVCDPSR